MLCYHFVFFLLGDASKTHSENFEEIMRKLTNMEDEKEDSIPQMNDAM